MALRTPAWVPAMLLAIALVPLGSAPTRAEYTLVVATMATFLLVVARGARGAGFFAVGDSLFGTRSSRALVALLGIPLFVFAQTLAAVLTGYTAGAPSEMMRAGLVLFSTAIFYVLVSDSIRDHATFKTVVVTVAAVGVLEAAYGIFTLLAGNDYLLFYRRWAYHDSATGTLVNRNHFALLMALTFPVTMVTAALARAQPGRHDRRRSDLAAQRALFVLAGVLVGVALVFSRSRMGVISFLAACVVVLLVAQVLRPDPLAGGSQARRVGTGIPLVSAALIAVYVVVIGATPAFERFANLWTDLETGRLPIWNATLAMIRDQPIVGHGWGSFDFLIDGYRDVPTGLDTSYAHNDYLQILAETGIVGFAFVAWLLLLLARRTLTALSTPMPEEARFTVVWLTVAIAAALIHSSADFGLRIPGVGFMFTALLALFLRVCEEPGLAVRPRSARRSRSRART